MTFAFMINGTASNYHLMNRFCKFYNFFYDFAFLKDFEIIKNLFLTVSIRISNVFDSLSCVILKIQFGKMVALLTSILSKRIVNNSLKQAMMKFGLQQDVPEVINMTLKGSTTSIVSFNTIELSFDLEVKYRFIVAFCFIIIIFTFSQII